MAKSGNGRSEDNLTNGIVWVAPADDLKAAEVVFVAPGLWP